MRIPPAKALLAWSLIALVAGGLAAETARDAATNYLARTRPRAALDLDPTHAKARAAELDARILAAGGSTKLQPGDVEAARLALRYAPLNAPLLRTIGLSKSLAGDDAGGRRIMQLAERVSRRDVLLQMWLIEDAVSRGNLEEALDHYDIALSISTTVQPLLFPILTSALSEPDIVTGVGRSIAQRRPWTDAFLDYAISNGRPAEVAALILRSGAYRRPEMVDRQQDLLGRFAGEGDIAGALRYAEALPEADHDALSTFGFSPRSTARRFAPLTWRLSDSGDVQAALEGDDRLSVNATTGAEGVAVLRIVALPAGHYRFRQRVSVDAQSAPASATWHWACVAPKRSHPIGAVGAPVAPGTHSQEVVIEVPKNCAGVRMELRVRGGDTLEPSQIAIDRVDLRPIS